MKKKRQRTPAERLAQLEMINWILAQPQVLPAVYAAKKQLDAWQWNDEKEKNEYNDPAFLTFWGSYPKKVGKGAAFRAWKRIKPGEKKAQQIIDSVSKHKNTPAWKKEEGRFIPNPATFLNQQRYDDEIEEKNERVRDLYKLEYDQERHTMVQVPIKQ